MTAAQNKSKISQLEQRLEDLNQDIAALQKYRVDSDGFANHERSKLAQLESRLMEAGYDIERAQKEKASLDVQLKRAVGDLQNL
jgi:uncharacterized protein (DUF342 family)